MAGAVLEFGRKRSVQPRWVGQLAKPAQWWLPLLFECPRFRRARPRPCALCHSSRRLPLLLVCYRLSCCSDIFQSEIRKPTRNKEVNQVLQRQPSPLIRLRISPVPLNCSVAAARRIERNLLDGRPAKPRLAVERYSLRRRYSGLCRIAPNRRMRPDSQLKALPGRPHAHSTDRCDLFAGVPANLPLHAECFWSKAQAN